MADVATVARTFRAGARRRGNPARVALAGRYGRVLTGLRADAERAERTVAALRRSGLTPSRATLDDLAEVRGLRDRTQARLLTVAATVGPLLDGETRREVLAAVRDAKRLTGLLGAPAADVDGIAVMNLVGQLRRGPVHDLLAARAGADADQVAQLLVDGLVLGRDPRTTAALMSQHVQGSSMASALRVVRTETHRARREASRVVYSQTGGISGWVWVCSLTPTSCGLCWAKHGTVHGLNEPMGTHPNCTCELAPFTGQDILTGAELFDALTDTEQDTALGAATARAYRAGAITLDELVGQRSDPEWGPVGAQRSLLSVLGADAAQFYRPNQTR